MPGGPDRAWSEAESGSGPRKSPIGEEAVEERKEQATKLYRLIQEMAEGDAGLDKSLMLELGMQNVAATQQGVQQWGFWFELPVRRGPGSIARRPTLRTREVLRVQAPPR